MIAAVQQQQRQAQRAAITRRINMMVFFCRQNRAVKNSPEKRWKCLEKLALHFLNQSRKILFESSPETRGTTLKSIFSTIVRSKSNFPEHGFMAETIQARQTQQQMTQ